MNIGKIFQYRGGLDGLKTIIGATLLVVGHQVGLLEQLLAAHPDVSILGQVLAGAKVGAGFLQQALDVVGNAMLVLGVSHKAVKLVG